jgi:hypothetical protein
VKWLCAGALGAGSGLLIGAVCGQPTVRFSATLGTNFALASCCFCCNLFSVVFFPCTVQFNWRSSWLLKELNNKRKIFYCFLAWGLQKWIPSCERFLMFASVMHGM